VDIDYDCHPQPFRLLFLLVGTGTLKSRRHLDLFFFLSLDFKTRLLYIGSQDGRTISFAFVDMNLNRVTQGGGGGAEQIKLELEEEGAVQL